MPDLLIAGASARAAAFSAVNAGLTVAAADLFADRDLCAVADATAVSDWPSGLSCWTDRYPRHVPLLFVGGLENEPELLAQFAATRPLFAPEAMILNRVRSPDRLARMFDTWQIPRPRLSTDGRCLEDASTWLIKPIRSAAGQGIRRSVGDDDLPREGEYRQEFIEGRPGSAAYCASETGVELLGVTEMLLPEASLKTILSPFTYCGSITESPYDTSRLDRIGQCLANAGLRGLFGVDFVVRKSGDDYEYLPIEVNPRYTASMEVLERRSRRSFIADHWAIFTTGNRASIDRHSAAFDCHGKLIVYAPSRCRVGELPLFRTSDLLRSNEHYEFADIPEPGTIVPAGAPICTVLAASESRAECMSRLHLLQSHVHAHCEPA